MHNVHAVAVVVEVSLSLAVRSLLAGLSSTGVSGTLVRGEYSRESATPSGSWKAAGDYVSIDQTDWASTGTYRIMAAEAMDGPVARS